MADFLEQLIDDIHAEHGTSLEHLCFVLPNKRAGLFLKDQLVKKNHSPFLSPTILSMEALLEKLSDTHVLEPVTLLFEFYNHFKAVEGAEAQPLDEFVRWAPQLLADFNEVDSHLLEAHKLFGYVNESRALEVWSVDGSPLSDTQKIYLKFWESLNSYYKSFTAYLKENKMAYEGLAARWALETIQEKVKNNQLSPLELHHKQMVFVGFNALTPAEEGVIRAYKKAGLAKIYWDTDAYYMGNKQQEAGHFLRKYREGWAADQFKWIGRDLQKNKREIELIGVASHVGQTKVVGEILQELKSENDFLDTAVVLINETLLIPALQSLPETIENVNVTMGYPLKNAALHGLVNTVFLMQENASRMGMRKGIPHFYHRDLVKLLSHPFLQNIQESRAIAKSIITGIRRKNRIFLSLEELEELTGPELKLGFDKIRPFFESWNNQPLKALESFRNVMENLRKELQNTERDLGKQKEIDLEYLFLYSRILKRMQSLIGTYQTIRSMKTLRVVFNQLIGSQSIPFYGEPLRGLQLMGLLETRLLDFKNVFLISANEDKLPAGKSQQSFFPVDIRREFGLPTFQERDAKAAYLFYRLLQRSEKVFCLYNTEPDEMGGGEKSRFLTQIEHELRKYSPNTSLKTKVMTIPVIAENKQNAAVKKSPEIIETIDQLMRKGISPSALNRFINCPLDFYYKYIIGLREEEDVEETIEATTLGSFVHQVLEDLFTPFLEKIVPSEAIDPMLNVAEEMTRKEFLKKFRKSELERGKNLLTLKVAIKFVKTFLQSEKKSIQNLEAKGNSLIILSLEQRLEKEIVVKGKKIKLVGLADRIDQAGAEVRVIDYKTGMVTPAELKVDDIEVLEFEPAKAKAFQLLTYALLHREVNGMKEESISSGIISFRKLSEGLMRVRFGKEHRINHKNLDQFNALVESLIERIYDLEEPFVHDPESKYCKFCGA